MCNCPLYKEEQIAYPIQITRTHYIKNTLQGSITHYINKAACSIQITRLYYIKNILQGGITLYKNKVALHKKNILHKEEHIT